MFEKKGVIIIEKANANISEDELMLLALDNGAENMEAEDEYFEITCNPGDFSVLREALENEGLTFAEAEIQMIPTLQCY